MKSFLLEWLPFKSPVFTSCTTRFTIQKSYVQPTQRMYTFCMDLRTVIISLHSINWLVVITETECLISYIFRTTALYTQYLTPTCCTMFVFVNYCSNMFWPQLVAIFKEVVMFFDMSSLCTHLSDRNSTCMTEIILRIKKSKY